MADHPDAFNYDLMTKLGIRLEDVPRTIGWHAAYQFSRNLSTDSALFRAKYPEEASFAGPLQRAALLADIFDTLAWFKHDFDSAHAEKGATLKKPKPYPRPWNDDEDAQQVGKGAIKVKDFDAWYYGLDTEEGVDGE